MAENCGERSTLKKISCSSPKYAPSLLSGDIVDLLPFKHESDVRAES